MNNPLHELYDKDSGRGDLLILTDEEDHILGFREKALCHEGDGLLHRAFSIFIFDRENRLLLHRRGASKPLWPLYWTNTVCSHPRKGEDYMSAAVRRLKEEMGVECESGLRYLFKFVYTARYMDIGSENELCSVFVGKTDTVPQPDPLEIAEFRYISVPALTQEMASAPETFTPWFKMEWRRIRAEYPEIPFSLKIN